MTAPGDRTYTTGPQALDAVIRAVRVCLPELKAVIRAYQLRADAPPPVEPFASVALAPMGPSTLPEVTFPWEDGTATDTTAPYSIPQHVTTHRTGVIAVTIFGLDAFELVELLDARMTGDLPTVILRDAGLDLVPLDVDDATDLDGDRWLPAYTRTFRVAYWRQDELKATGIDTATITAPTVSQET